MLISAFTNKMSGTVTTYQVTLKGKLSSCDLVAPTSSICMQVLLITYLQATETPECKTIPCYVQLAKHVAKLRTNVKPFHAMCSLQNMAKLSTKDHFMLAQQP
jgi:hypothetical protein